MKIQDSSISLSSRHEYDSRHEIETHSVQSFRAVMQDVSGPAETRGESERERTLRMLQSLIDTILKAVEGKKCRVEIADCRAKPETPQPAMKLREMEWHWESTETIREHERTRIEGCGVVHTADGKEIDFDLKMDMCRNYNCVIKYGESGKVVLHDPLVINFDGKAAELTGDRLDFDLNSDGQAESLAGLGAGSGFLVLDRNGNGRADDGKELFGASSGDGFAELAALDADRNGWLDEADPAFADLRVWSGKGGDQKLASLSEKGVGALWLGSTASPFSIKDEANQLLGEIRATGLYLREDGRVGSLQQVDLAVEETGRA